MTITSTPHQEITPYFTGTLPFTTNEVNDLAWLLHNPSLVDLEQTPCEQINNNGTVRPLTLIKNRVAANQWLKTLDNAPPSNLPKRTDYKRLGLYFEALFQFALCSPALNSVYRMVDHHLPVRSTGITLGEIDFIIENHMREKIHVEVTVKYFLQHSAASKTHWLGPNANDAFAKKFSRLFSHQLPLSNTTEFARSYPQHTDISGRFYVFAGELFHHWKDTAQTPPHGNRLCQRGHWLYASEFLALLNLKQYHWRYLPKLHWLAGNSDAQNKTVEFIQTTEDLARFFNADTEHQLQTRAFCFERYHWGTSHFDSSATPQHKNRMSYLGRVMVVPNYWPATSAPARNK